jgi:hypothetical protein
MGGNVFIVKIGQVYGKLTVSSRVGKSPGGIHLWECKCICGRTRVVRTDHLRGGNVQLCKRKRNESAGDYNSRHRVGVHTN